MGNWFGRSKLMAKAPKEKDRMMTNCGEEDERRRRSLDAAPSSPIQIKVRMTKKQLEELMAKAGRSLSQGSSEVARLIVKECSEGKLSPRVVLGKDHHVFDSSKSRRLSLTTIFEEEDEEKGKG
ncbi:hypothetical protein CCACVL1_21957 [Corchorus capsularis]|uniref:Uncharacterized protein n=1 Tax=Corchorus capsularis TaxID=210143 RepID=A0A1R3H1K3_COCAP|nr:hypothetical protein CCACVL1_21957 [Corchorus capsularis]